MNTATFENHPTPRALLSCLALAWLSGCALQPVPSGEMAAADRAIARALRSGAAEWAPRELRLAQEKMALTRRCLDGGEPAPVRWLAEQAQVDAELAAVKSVLAAAR